MHIYKISQIAKYLKFPYTVLILKENYKMCHDANCPFFVTFGGQIVA